MAPNTIIQIVPMTVPAYVHQYAARTGVSRGR
jgi:hypothetical protein